MHEAPVIELRKDYLYVKASGVRTQFSEIMEGTVLLYEASKAYKADKIFADYTEVRFKVPLTEAFNLLRFYEKNLPEFYDVSMSALINPLDQEIAEFWESICRKRGFNVAIFTDLDESKEWLKRQ